MNWAVFAEELLGSVSAMSAPDGNGASLVPQAFAAPGRLGTRVVYVAQAASEYDVTFVVPADELEDAVRSAHPELGLEKRKEP